MLPSFDILNVADEYTMSNNLDLDWLCVTAVDLERWPLPIERAELRMKSTFLSSHFTLDFIMKLPSSEVHFLNGRSQ